MTAKELTLPGRQDIILKNIVENTFRSIDEERTENMEIRYIRDMELQAQKAFIDENRLLLQKRFGHPPRAMVKSFGCAQNVNDGEKLAGMLQQMGCSFTESVEEADIRE